MVNEMDNIVLVNNNNNNNNQIIKFQQEIIIHIFRNTNIQYTNAIIYSVYISKEHTWNIKFVKVKWMCHDRTENIFVSPPSFVVIIIVVVAVVRLYL